MFCRSFFFGSRCYTSLVANAYSAAFFVPYKLFFCCPAESNLTAESTWVAWPWLTVQHYGLHPSGHWLLAFSRGPRAESRGTGLRRVKSAAQFPSVFLRFQNAVVLTKTISSVFLRSPPFSSVFLCFFYTVCATFSSPTPDGLVGQTIRLEPALCDKDQGLLDPFLCLVAFDGVGWSDWTGDVADTFLRRALGWHSFLHGWMSCPGITEDVVRAKGLDGSG